MTQISVCGSAALLLTHLDPSKNACGELVCDGLHLFIRVVLKHAASALGSARGLLVSVPVPNPEPLYRSKVTLMVNGSKIQPRGFSPSVNAAAPSAVAIFQHSTESGKGVISCLLWSCRGTIKLCGDLHASHQK